MRPELKRETLLDLVEQKKSTVGAGFLTNQGALFLVASEMGVALKPLSGTSMGLSEIDSEKVEMTIVSRILSIGAPKIFTRRADSRFGYVAKVTVFDRRTAASVSVWNSDVFFRLLETALAPGDPVRITGVYSRKSYDGTSFSLSTSDKSEFVKLAEDDRLTKDLPNIGTRSVGVNALGSLPLGSILIVKGKVNGSAETSEFSRKDGTRGSYSSLTLGPSDNEGAGGRSYRVVLWENTNSVFRRLRSGEEVTLLNLKAKKTLYQGNEDVQLYGDEATVLLEHWDESKLWIEGEHSSVVAQLAKLDGPRGASPVQAQVQARASFIARVLSIGDEEKGSGSRHLLVTDSGKRRISVTALNDSAAEAEGLRVDDVILCKPDTIDLVGLKATCTKKGALFKVNPLREDIPKSNTLVAQIDRIEADSTVSLDCMVISVAPAREIQTKEGLVRRSEASLADPTGEIKLYAWRGLSKKLEGLSPGVRMWLRAVEAQSHEGKKFLVYKSYSRIEPSSG